MSEIFESVPMIRYEGPKSSNPLAFRYYNADEMVGGKSMRDQLRFAVAYWHTLTGSGSDPFGLGTMQRPWDNTSGMEQAEKRAHAAFELMQKLGIEYYTFHDWDIAPQGKNLHETNKNLDYIVDLLKCLMKDTGIKLLWGTANLTSHPCYVHGASTSCNPQVFARAAAQVKKMLEITNELGGENYVFWGGREGYETLLNTNMRLELDNYARLLQMAVDYAKEIGFTGQMLIEPKPHEPAKHQYDSDVAACLGFLRHYGLTEHFKMNIEANHATLAGHSFQHELRHARDYGMLGSIDANQGDLMLGWDTDQFATDLTINTLCMYEVLSMGGFTSGGLNFDAKVRRASFEPDDLFYGHIAQMDAFALAFKAAQAMIDDGALDDFIAKRYAGYSDGLGADIVAGKVGLKELFELAQDEDPTCTSGRQEMLENIFNRYILEAGV